MTMTRDVSLNHSSSTPWPDSAGFNIPGQPSTIPQPTDQGVTLSPDAEGSHHVSRRSADHIVGIRTSFKADLQASVAELVYGEPVRIPDDLLNPTADPVEPAHLITQLRRHMARLRPIPATHYASSATFLHKDFHNCTHAFLRQDATCRALEPPYSVPYKALSRREKTLQLLMRGKPVSHSPAV
jgi:hypothetical protein